MKTLHSVTSGIAAAGSRRLLMIPLLVCALMFTYCSSDQPGSTSPILSTDFESEILHNSPELLISANTASLLKEVKKRTARFNSPTQAIRAGYAPDDHCVEHPELGGMGYHWVNGPLIDDEFDPIQPEVILYERDKNGNLKITGVEYIVINVGQDQPYFGDHPFDVGGTPIPDPHWSLHVWLFKDNPSGMFAPFNPNVSCP